LSLPPGDGSPEIDFVAALERERHTAKPIVEFSSSMTGFRAFQE
jgi:hypothetical protein